MKKIVKISIMSRLFFGWLNTWVMYHIILFLTNEFERIGNTCNKRAVCLPSRVDFHYNSTTRIRRNQTKPFNTNEGGRGGEGRFFYRLGCPKGFLHLSFTLKVTTVLQLCFIQQLELVECSRHVTTWFNLPVRIFS